MANPETNNREQQEKSNLLVELFRSLQRMITEGLKQKITADIYDKDGVLGKKFEVAQSLFNDASRATDQNTKQRLLEQAAWVVIEVKQNKADLVRARDSVKSDLNTGEVKRVLNGAVDSQHTNWSAQQKQEMKQRLELELRKRENEAISTSPVQKKVTEENENLETTEIARKRKLAVEEELRLIKKKEKQGDGELSDREFDDRVDDLFDEIRRMASEEGLELGVFAQTDEQKFAVGDLDARLKSLEEYGKEDGVAGVVLEKLIDRFAEVQHMLPPAERARYRAAIDENSHKFVRVTAELRMSDGVQRYNPEPDNGNGERMAEIEAWHEDLARRYAAGEITEQQMQNLINERDVGDQTAYRRALGEASVWNRGRGRRGATIENPYRGISLDQLEQFQREGGAEGFSPDSLMGLRDPERMMDAMEDRVRREYGENVRWDDKLYEQVVASYVMRIIQSEASARSDYNVLQLKSELDLLLRSEKVLGKFNITDKRRDDKRDQVGMVMFVFEGGIAGASMNMEQWVGLMKNMPTEGYADQLGFSFKTNVKYLTSRGEEKWKEVELKVGDFVDIIYNKSIAKQVMHRDFNERRNGMERMAFYAVASQLEGWKDIKKADGTTDFSKLEWERLDDKSGFLVWMGDKSNAVKLLGMQDALGGNSMFKGPEELKNYASSLSKYVVNMELNVTLGLSRFNHDYSGHFNDQIYKHIGNAYARRFGIPLYHVLFEAMDPLKRDPVTETYYKQNRESMVTLIAENGLWKKDKNGEIMRDANGRELVDAAKVSALISTLQFLTTDREGYRMTKEQMIKEFEALMIKRETLNSYGVRESRLERLPDLREKREAMKRNLAMFIDNPDFNWEVAIFHHLQGSLKPELDGEKVTAQNWKKIAMRRLHVASEDELPEWLTLKGQDGFKTFLMLETSSAIYSNKSLEEQRKTDNVHVHRESEYTDELVEMDGGPFAHDFAKQAAYLGESVAAKAAMFKLANRYDMEAFVKFVDSKGEGAYNFMTREQREWQYIKILLAKDKVFRRQARNLMYKLDRNNTLKLKRDSEGRIVFSEEGTPVFESEEKRFYHQGHKRGAGIEPPWMSKWVIDRLWGSGDIYNDDSKEYIMGKSVETVAGINMAKLTFHPFGWVKRLPVVGKYLEGFVPYEKRWGPGPMINAIRKKWNMLDKPKYVSDVFGEWANIVMGEIKKADGLS